LTKQLLFLFFGYTKQLLFDPEEKRRHTYNNALIIVGSETMHLISNT